MVVVTFISLKFRLDFFLIAIDRLMFLSGRRATKSLRTADVKLSRLH